MSLNAILFIIGCVIFVLYLVGYVMVITSQNKIQDKEQGKSSNNK
jgi:flagellar basal body-associated protein FliL|tara:strand:- start:571 stop:705 length:135 start_codon:yes stop_codon:yes gene_type:complete